MESEIITTEIRNFFTHMGFAEELKSIEVHTGATLRYSVWFDREKSYTDEEGHHHSSLVNMLIGERGNNLVAAEHMIKKIVKKKYGEDEKFTLDINEYRMKRLEELKQEVKNAAKAVRLYGKGVPLRPMSAFERRIVHLLLAEYPDIATESSGVEPDRKVTIKPYLGS